MKWITLTDDSPLVEQGYHAMAPALVHSSALSDVFSSGHYILQELLGDEEVVMNHDTDWTLFPEVGEALKEQGIDEMSFCVAVCASHGKWAVGLAGNWKKREQATRLALCVALAANAESLSGVVSQHPAFGQLCADAGIVIEDDEGVAPPLQPPVESYRPKKRRTSAAPASHEAEWNPKSPVVTDGASFPRDAPLWITLSEGKVPQQLEGFTLEGLSVASDGGRKGLYNQCDEALKLVLGPDSGDVEYHDDANWEHFPQVGAVLKAITGKEECLTLAICPSRASWALGVGMKGKNRYAAAKLALATTLAIEMKSVQQDFDLSELPSFADFVEEARIGRGA